MRHLLFGNPGMLAMAEHVMDVGHGMKFIKACGLDRAAGYVDHMVREAVEIRLHPSNCNRDGVSCWTKSGNSSPNTFGIHHTRTKARDSNL